jgi:transposase
MLLDKFGIWSNAFPKMVTIRVAYYDEYMPYERLEKDIRMMKEAGITVIRIAESPGVRQNPRMAFLTLRTLTGSSR